MNDSRTPPADFRIGYLTNVYPAVSHSFIKREILALEAQGIAVQRWSIRPGGTDLPDQTDRDEAGRTKVILASPAAIVLAALRVSLTRPLRTLRALKASMAGRPAGAHAAVVRVAHLAEACFLALDARRTGVRHIHAHFGTNPASVARLCYLLGGPGYSFTVHGPDEFDQPLAHALGPKIADARFVVGISQFGRSQLMRWCQLDEWGRIHVVRCGLDHSFLKDPGPPPAQDGVPVFSCVARLAPQKGLPLLVEAAALLRDQGRRFLIRIVGDGDLRGRLEAAIAERGLEDCFDLVGWASSDRVRDVIRNSRAFVLPSFAEGLPVAIMEALAMRCPVVVTRIAGIPELVDGECGWVIDAGSAGQLAEAMAGAMDADAANCSAMGQVGRDRVLAAHDADRNAAQIASLVRAALAA